MKHFRYSKYSSNKIYCVECRESLEYLQCKNATFCFKCVKVTHNHEGKCKSCGKPKGANVYSWGTYSGNIIWQTAASHLMTSYGLQNQTNINYETLPYNSAFRNL